MFRKPKKKPAALRGAGGGPSPSAGPTNTNSSDGASASPKKRRRPRRNSSSSSEDDDDEDNTSGLLQQIRQERDNGKSNKAAAPLLNTSSTSNATKKKSKNNDNNNWMHQYKSNDTQMTAQEMATRTAEYHPTETKQPQSSDGQVKEGEGDAATTKNAEIAALQTNKPRSKFLAGPLRATTFVRTTARFDYQPDICKDYKETGFCGFGDTCIYLHDRGDTKTGWQMEQEYEEKKKREEERKGREMDVFMKSMMTCGDVNMDGGMSTATTGVNEDISEDASKGVEDDGIPFACHICRGPFTNPIVTTCGHYFCERCMLSRIRGSSTTNESGGSSGCPICQKDTHGVLNYAQKLVAKKRRLVGRDGSWEEYLKRSRKSDGDEE